MKFYGPVIKHLRPRFSVQLEYHWSESKHLLRHKTLMVEYPIKMEYWCLDDSILKHPESIGLFSQVTF